MSKQLNVDVVLKFGRLIAIRLHWGGIVRGFIVYVGYAGFICPRRFGCVNVRGPIGLREGALGIIIQI